MAATSRTQQEFAFFAKRLSENVPVFVQRTGVGDPERYQGILVGNIMDKTLVIGELERVHLEPDEKIVVRMALGNHIVGFETVVTKVVENPILYLIKFPVSIETMNLRKVQRVHAFFPADVQLAKQSGDDHEVMLLKTRVMDISAGGCGFRSKTRLPANQEVAISFSLPGDRRVQSVKGTVLESQAAGPAFHNRVRFIQDPANLPILQEVAQWVNESMAFGANTQ